MYLKLDTFTFFELLISIVIKHYDKKQMFIFAHMCSDNQFKLYRQPLLISPNREAIRLIVTPGARLFWRIAVLSHNILQYVMFDADLCQVYMEIPKDVFFFPPTITITNLKD